MAIQARYVHTNLVARDWRALAKFYIEVFGCRLVPPERDLSEPWIAECTGVPNARLTGAHFRFPGYGETGPTLEVFQYDREPPRPPVAANTPGFGHIAFSVEDVPAAREEVLRAGGKDLGRLSTATVPGAGRITLIYMTDPEGNIIELQRWS